MASASEEKPNSPQEFASKRAAIFETFNKLKKWREDQVNQFRSMQLLECQKMMQLSGENQKQFEKLLQNSVKSPEPGKSRRDGSIENSPVSFASDKNDLDGYNTLHDSSITGHLLRCFNDSSQSSISTGKTKVDFAENSSPFTGSQTSEFTETNQSENNKMLQQKDIVKCPPGKAKFPYLKKGTGLLKYTPNSVTSAQTRKYKVRPKSNQVKRNIQLPQKTLNLKPAIRKTDVTSERNKHIRFDIPSDINLNHNEFSDENDVPTVSTSVANTKISSYDESEKSPASSNEDDKMKDTSNSGNESMSLETKELQEFELLEKCAENSSFNSDSSVVQRLLQADRAKNFKINQKPIPKIIQGNSEMKHVSDKSSSENSIFSSKFGLGKCLEEVQARKQVLQKVISDINPRIQSLQREIANCNQEALDDSDMSERCSTPIGDLNTENRVLSPIVPENESNLDLSDLPPPSVSESNIDDNCHINCKCCNVDDVLKDIYSNENQPEECENSESSQQYDQVTNQRLKIHEKLQELENEIKIYQEHNAKLSSICKERDEILRKLQKERDDFNKYKEAEKNKLDAEMQEGRKQIKRQKETFTRYQKLRKDHPTRKERDELNALRQENEKLQEELKRQKIKYANDCRRLRTQLETAEKETDSFKLENIRLEEQCQDLLTALKTRMKKNKAEILPLKNKNDEKATTTDLYNEVSKQKESVCVPEKESDSESCKNIDQVNPKILTEKKSKSKVRFNLVTVSENNKFEHTEICPEKEIFVESKAQEQEIFVGSKVQEKEIFVGSKVQEKERFGESKAREDYELERESEPVIPEECSKKDPQAVNLSTISVSVEAEFKEINLGNKIERIYPSGEREIKFQSGTRKVISADGQSTKFYFYNGDSKEIFPDKRETYKYVNGVTETHFPDGLEVTEFPDGQIQRCHPDGQKEIKYPNGTTHNIYADGSEEINSADGNIVRLSADGTETINFSNGQKEIRTSAYKRREFPDGSVKIVYESGRQETRYSNGRIRIKDKEGKVIVDTKYLGVSKG